MGYASQVRFTTTKSGFEKIKKLATQKYNELLSEAMKEGEVDTTNLKDNEVCIRVKFDDGGGSYGVIYYKELPTDYEVVRETSDGKYVMFGMDWVKWMGYNHLERKATEWACDKCGEFVRCLLVGEDGATEETEWNDEKDDGDMPYLTAYTRIDDDAWY